MAEKDFTENKQLFPWDGKSKHFVVKHRLDFSKVPMVNADAARAMAVPAGVMVKNVVAKVVTPEGGAGAFTIGHAAGDAGFEGNGDINAVAGTRTKGIGGTDADVTAGGYLYTSDGYLFFEASVDLDAAIVDLATEVVDFR